LRAKLYPPRPISTSKIKLTPEFRELIEKPARNAHQVWMADRRSDFRERHAGGPETRHGGHATWWLRNAATG